MNNESMAELFLVLWLGTIAAMVYLNMLVLHAIAQIKDPPKSKDKEEA